MSFRTTDFFVRLPLIGLIARNSKNFHVEADGWMNAEVKLCTEYKKYVNQITEKQFLQRIEYMKAAHDLGRTPMGAGHKVFLFLLIAAEAMGFSYLLGTWIARDASANTYNYLMYGIVFVLASVLAIVTHQAGEQFYRTRLKRACFARYKESRQTDSHTTKPIALSDDQYIDEPDLPARRCLNRIAESDRDMGSYWKCWVALLFVAVIFAGSAYMRIKHMQTELTNESTAAEATQSNPFAAPSQAPGELIAAQRESDKQARQEVLGNTEGEGIAAILILSVIFAVTQIVGFSAGYQHSFAGRQTYQQAEGQNTFWFWKEWTGAYADTWGYTTYEQYWKTMAPVKATVNARLKKLQHILMEKSPVNLFLKKTFEDFLTEHDAKDRARMKALNSQDNPPAAEPVVVSPPPAPPQTAPAADPLPLQVDRAKASIESIPDRAAQQEYFKSLPVDVREALEPWLIERKKKMAAISQQKLDDLF